MAAEEALPAKLVVTSGHIIGDDHPRGVVKAKDLVYNQLEGLLESRLRCCIAETHSNWLYNPAP